MKKRGKRVSNGKKIGLLLGIAGIVIVGLGISTRSNNNNDTQIEVKRAGSYVALGDSVAAGVGLETATDSSACDRHDESYPGQLANERNFELTNIACTGATISKGVSGPQTVNNLELETQLNQLKALEKPDVITLQVGANDVRLLGTLAQCYAADCSSRQLDFQFTPRLNEFKADLDSTLSTLDDMYKEDKPAVVLAGYYMLFSTTAKSCSDSEGISDEEMNLGVRYVEKLNTVLKSAKKKYDNVRYVVPDFSGHELCTSNPYVQGLNDPSPFHPTKEGHKVYANAVADILKSEGAAR